MGIKSTLFDFGANTLIKGLGLHRASKVGCKLIEKIQPTSTHHTPDGHTITLACPNELTRWRAMTYFDKEPETIEWIQKFKKNERMIDIGANIGLYSIYAAKRGAKVCAFEPESQNYAVLNKNIYLNSLSDRVTALNIAIADTDRLDFLYLPQFYAGAALNNFGDAKDYEKRDFTPSYKQGVVSFSLDSFLKLYPEMFPDHLKIDVDGIEPKIIQGAKETLKNPKLKSILIEFNEKLPEDLDTSKTIQNYGFKLAKKCHSPMASQGDFATIFNYVFYRD